MGPPHTPVTPWRLLLAKEQRLATCLAAAEQQRAGGVAWEPSLVHPADLERRCAATSRSEVRWLRPSDLAGDPAARAALVQARHPRASEKVVHSRAHQAWDLGNLFVREVLPHLLLGPVLSHLVGSSNQVGVLGPALDVPRGPTAAPAPGAGDFAILVDLRTGSVLGACLSSNAPIVADPSSGAVRRAAELIDRATGRPAEQATSTVAERVAARAMGIYIARVASSCDRPATAVALADHMAAAMDLDLRRHVTIDLWHSSDRAAVLCAPTVCCNEWARNSSATTVDPLDEPARNQRIARACSMCPRDDDGRAARSVRVATHVARSGMPYDETVDPVAIPVPCSEAAAATDRAGERLGARQQPWSPGGEGLS